MILEEKCKNKLIEENLEVFEKFIKELVSSNQSQNLFPVLYSSDSQMKFLLKLRNNNRKLLKDKLLFDLNRGIVLDKCIARNNLQGFSEEALTIFDNEIEYKDGEPSTEYLHKNIISYIYYDLINYMKSAFKEFETSFASRAEIDSSDPVVMSTLGLENFENKVNYNKLYFIHDKSRIKINFQNVNNLINNLESQFLNLEDEKHYYNNNGVSGVEFLIFSEMLNRTPSKYEANICRAILNEISLTLLIKKYEIL